MDVDAARRHAGLKPLPHANDHEAKTKPDVITEDATIGNEERLRGIPAVGRVSGTMKGCRPGDPVWRLEREQQEAKALNDRARRIVSDRISANGILRKRRTTE